MAIRFLHLADTHLGARHPARVGGDPFLAGFRRALEPARRGAVDLVVHGGDLFHRSRPPPRLLAEAAAALVEAADGGAHVVVVAGNHERAQVPCRLLLAHPRIHLVTEPRRISLDLRGFDLSIFAFPFLRRDPRGRFRETLRRTGWPAGRGRGNWLACHQTFDGATVGPADFTFRWGSDVIPRSFVPPELDYAALGHIHRHQYLAHPRRQELALAYPGSTERTSRAERHEEKGVIHGLIASDGTVRTKFVTLPTVRLPETTGPFARGASAGTYSAGARP
jgi:exonuclease SbcD